MGEGLEDPIYQITATREGKSAGSKIKQVFLFHILNEDDLVYVTAILSLFLNYVGSTQAAQCRDSWASSQVVALEAEQFNQWFARCTQIIFVKMQVLWHNVYVSLGLIRYLCRSRQCTV